MGRSPRCPSGRGEVASSAAAEVHGTLTVAWVGTDGRGPVVAELLGNSRRYLAHLEASAQLQIWTFANRTNRVVEVLNRKH